MMHNAKKIKWWWIYASANEGQSLFTNMGLKNVSQNDSLSFQIKVWFVIDGPTQTNHNKNLTTPIYPKSKA